MEQQKINLSQILEAKNKLAFEEGYSNYFTAAQRNIIFKAMEESIKQTLELAAENANVIEECKFNDIHRENDFGIIVNKQSILNTLEQIEYY